MTFSNPAGDAASGASAYTARLLALLGDRPPLEVMEQLEPWLSSIFVGLRDRDVRRAEAPGKWSMLEVLVHLADTELVYGYRVRLILAADRPAIPGYDQDAWSRRLRYNQEDPAAALEDLHSLRRRNLRLYRSLTAEELAREGLHSERGPESVGRILQLLAAHDLVHRRQIERIRGASNSA